MADSMAAILRDRKPQPPSYLMLGQHDAMRALLRLTLAASREKNVSPAVFGLSFSLYLSMMSVKPIPST